MAGIGFELKKLFSHKGILATINAYGYAGIVCVGPMLLGVALLLGVMFLANLSNISRNERELLVSMITYALFASLVVTSGFSMLTTRYTADMMYEKKYEKVMPSFYGSVTMMLLVGGLCYGVFLCFSGIMIEYKLLSFVFFMTLIVTWAEMNYLTAIKNYKGIMRAFFVAMLITFLIGYIFIKWVPINPVVSLMFSVCVGYGIMSVWYFVLIYKYFPEGFGSSIGFIRWIEKYPELIGIGLLLTIGLFGHLIITWTSPIGEQIKGLFYGAPEYDVSALVAFFSILITSINFVTSVEVRFYPQYKNYFALFNSGGSIGDIENAEVNMLKVLKDEISFLAQKQVFTTILFIVIGSMLLPKLTLGFNSDMLGMFRILCVGYALYAIGNSVMLILLYFADNKGAFYASLCFALTTNLFTIAIKYTAVEFYGFGFFIGSAIFCVVAFLRLQKYLEKLKYHILSEQPVFEIKHSGFLTRTADKYDARAKKKQFNRKKYNDDRREVLTDDIQ